MCAQNQRKKSPMYLEILKKRFYPHPSFPKANPLGEKRESKRHWQVTQMASGYISPRILCSFNRCWTSRKFCFAKRLEPSSILHTYPFQARCYISLRLIGGFIACHYSDGSGSDVLQSELKDSEENLPLLVLPRNP